MANYHKTHQSGPILFLLHRLNIAIQCDNIGVHVCRALRTQCRVVRRTWEMRTTQRVRSATVPFFVLASNGHESTCRGNTRSRAISAAMWRCRSTSSPVVLNSFLSPLRGWHRFLWNTPRLAPWAAIFRPLRGWGGPFFRDIPRLERETFPRSFDADGEWCRGSWKLFADIQPAAELVYDLTLFSFR